MKRATRARFLCCLALATVAGDVWAEEQMVRWTSTEGCLTEEELSTLVQRQLPAPEGERLRSVVGTARLVEANEVPPSYEIVLEVHESGRKLGQRVLTLAGPDCRSHDETIALVVALLLEHGAPEPPADPDDAGEEGSPAPAEPEEDPPPVALDPGSDSPAQAWPFRVFGGVALTWGWFSRAAVGPQVGLGVSPFGGVWLDLLGTYYPPQNDSGQAGAYDFRSLGGRVHARGCGGPELDRFRLQGCLGIGAGFAKLSGQGTAQVYEVLYAPAEARGDVLLFMKIRGPVFLSLGGSVLAPFSRARFVFIEQGEEAQVHETHQILGEMSAHISVEF